MNKEILVSLGHNDRTEEIIPYVESRLGRRAWLISVIGKLQRLSEKFLLVGLAIAIRKKIESCAIPREADIDTAAHCRIGFQYIAQNLIPFFRPSSRL
jgi:hypothetical protein